MDSATIKVGPKRVNLARTSGCIIPIVMRSGAPRNIADVLAAAVPQIADRLPEYRIRKAWSALVGPDVARRTRPQSLANGCLHVVVDNSPWLHEPALRGAQLTAPLHGRADAVRSL